MKRNKKVKLISFVLSLIIVLIGIVGRISYSLKQNSSSDALTLKRINEIRSTKNTDVSNITGSIFYVSNDGDDNNDGLSQNSAWKTLNKLNQMMSSKTVKNGDAVLFRRGDTFRGNVALKDNNITLGSYGNESLSKPKIWGSSYNAAKEGEWEELYTNYWVYKVNGENAIFPNDIGGVWYFCDSKSNKNCDRTTTDGKTFYAFGQKTSTWANVEETPESIAGVLHKDLAFYHAGQASASTTKDASGTSMGGAKGQQLIVYSVGNPATRFDDIEISLGKNGIAVGQLNNIVVDNLQISFFGAHGVGAGTLSNLTVTNCEISFVGGMNQKFDSNEYWPLRYGNGIEIYGSIESKTNYPVKDGFVVRNNYVYEIYDAGLTFQNTAAEGKSSKVERVVFDNNVVEYCSYDIEYWNGTNETQSTSIINKTYINKVYFTNNILRYAGMGYTETRPEHGYEALIKTWDGSNVGHNVIRDGGEFLIENNILDTTGQLKDNKGNLVGTWMLHICASNEGSMPTIRNNKFYNFKNRNLGYVYTNDTVRNLIPYGTHLSYNSTILKDNEFNVYESEDQVIVKEGKSNEVNYKLDLQHHTLTISGSGKMADYSTSNPAPWQDYADQIYVINIGEDVTYLGKYAFYNCYYVQTLNLNAKNLLAMSNDSNNTFTNLGRKTTGTSLNIGENVEIIPQYFTNSTYTNSGSPFITKINFNGNKLKTIDKYGLAFIFVSELIIPDSVENINDVALAANKTVKIVKLPKKLTTLKKSVLKNCANLEMVIFGESLTTLEENSLLTLPNLSTIVIPSDNFTLPTDVTFMDQISPIGLQIFGPNSLESAITTMNEQYSDKLHFIPITSYRPLVVGDSENFIVRFDEMAYGGSAAFQVNALANANVNITGAKYRYMDRFNHKHLMDGVEIDLDNNSLSNVFMDVELQGTLTNVNKKTIDDQAVLFLGNSLLRGFNTHGMSSTDLRSDYYYYVMQYLKSMNPNISSYKYTANPWEGKTNSEARATELDAMINDFNKQNVDKKNVGLVFLQLGDNVNSAERRETFPEDMDAMMKRFKSEYPNAKIYYLFGWYNYSNMVETIKQVCINNDIELIDFNQEMHYAKRYQSYVGARYINSSFDYDYVANSGVGTHPGDYGFTTIADTVIKRLKEYYAPTKANEVTSYSYEIKNKTVYAKPTTLTFNKKEFINNLNINGDYEIYNDNTKVTTNDIGTGYEIRVGDNSYKIVVLGDLTGDGLIEIGDVAAIYNHYRGRKTLPTKFVEAGKLTGSDNIELGDISKLYNFYRGRKGL